MLTSPVPALVLSFMFLNDIGSQVAAISAQPIQNVRLPGADVSMPAVKSRVLPAYPLEAGAASVRGTIEMEVVVDRRGAVAQARVTKSISDRSDLDGSALDAINKWEFSPGLASARTPVAVLVRVTMMFEPSNGSQAGTVSANVTPIPPFAAATSDLFASAIALPGPATRGIQLPKMMRAVSPSYTSDAMRAKIQGVVELEVVVMPDGTVGAVRITKSLDDRYGLDEQAVAAAGRWFFEPGTKDGRTVATIVTLVLEFRLH